MNRKWEYTDMVTNSFWEDTKIYYLIGNLSRKEFITRSKGFADNFEVLSVIKERKRIVTIRNKWGKNERKHDRYL